MGEQHGHSVSTLVFVHWPLPSLCCPLVPSTRTHGVVHDLVVSTAALCCPSSFPSHERTDDDLRSSARRVHGCAAAVPPPHPCTNYTTLVHYVDVMYVVSLHEYHQVLSPYFTPNHSTFTASHCDERRATTDA